LDPAYSVRAGAFGPSWAGWFCFSYGRAYAVFAMGAIGGIALSIWLCGLAEKQLPKRSQLCRVDEISGDASLLCWLARCLLGQTSGIACPTIFRKETWLLTAGTFVLFRFFDILKPWPVRQSQALSGGWGVTGDDLLAAAYTAVASGLLAAKLPTGP
jgi:phosphatidylglycerophosphatase A